MSRISLSTTPCPTTALNPSLRRISSFELFGDDTANIDFTRAIDQPLTGIKPRRRSMMTTAPKRKTAAKAAVTIFEDVPEDHEMLLVEKKVTGKTLLSKPPAKMAAAAASKQKDGGMGDAPGMEGNGTNASISGGLRVGNVNGGDGNIRGHGLKKNPRRQTMFVPEDTSFLTIHPGANDTRRLDDSFQLPSYSTQKTISGINGAGNPRESRAAKPRASLAVAPKRLPLRETPSSGNISARDLPGANNEKENIPPRGLSRREIVEKNGGEHHSAPFLQLQAASADVAYIHYDFRTNRPKELGSSRITLVTRPGVRESARGKMDGTTRLVKPSTTTVTSTHLSKATKCSPKIGQHPGHLPVKGHAGTNLRRGSPKADQATAATEKKNIRDFIHTKRMEKESEKLKQYPVLSSNLSQPGLYEDGWLSHQEAALTEVVNAIFRAVDDGDRTSKQPLLEELVELYNQPEVTALHRRLQASLDYGALAPPKDALRMPATDIGLRKRLAGLWLENYDTEALRAAVQVISGRQLPPVNSSPQTLDPHAGQRNLAAFLEMFFISMADVDHTSSGALSDDAIALRFKKMMARNLMMIWLLDQAKTNGALGEGRRLFKSTSTKKSSQAVLHGLMSLLLPFIGDPMRSLKHMGYEITHVQDPLDEVVYHVNNLATDLRDGVLLCRLVEILLHGSSTTLLSGHNISEDTMTIRMPDETMLVTDIGMLSVSPRPMRTLSQHLKIPCIGHAQRAYNVQIALSALESHSVDASNVVGSIQAEDVVKGHRERTLSLLWSLISVYGLEYLVDFDHLAASVPSSPDRAQMLQSWAALHAQKSGIKVDNLTGSFVDGRVYQAILEGFSTCVGQSGTIQDRLQTIGCSKAFTEKLTSAIGVVPSRETTLSNLAFLASRLLPLQRQYDAAAVIQRAFRHHRARGIASQRIRLLRLAHDCAQVALARARVTAAATVVQRAWRRVLDHRIERLDRDVMAFQVVARGWAVRRRGRLTRW